MDRLCSLCLEKTVCTGTHMRAYTHTETDPLRLTLNTHKVTAHTEELFEIQFQSLKLLFETPLKRDYFKSS